MNILPMPEIRIEEQVDQGLKDYLDANNLQRIFIVTGPHVSRTGAFARLMETIEKGRAIEIFKDTQADPTFLLIDDILAGVRSFRADAVIGIGGGSPLDAAKITAALADKDIAAMDLIEGSPDISRKLKLILIPTSSGTGSEVTPLSILTDEASQLKKGISHVSMIPDAAFLYAEMTVTMPASVTASTGIDALCHATEAYLSRKQNPYSDMMALKALKLIGENLLTACRKGDHLQARKNMLEASFYAGLAFANSSVTAVHAFAYPLGGMHHIPHGLANSLMFAPVFRFNLPGNEQRFAELAGALGAEAAAEALIPAVEKLQRDLELPHSLEALGIPSSDLEIMAQKVMNITRLLSVNPNEIQLDDARRIYQEAYKGYII